MRMKTVEAMMKTKSSVEAMTSMKVLYKYNEVENCRSYDEDYKLCSGYDEDKSSVETMMRKTA
jgi:hypothetical protein